MLIAKQYVFAFPSGVIVIKDWKIHNHIRPDRFKSTLYTEEKSSLYQGKGGAYTDHPISDGNADMSTCLPDANQMPTQDRSDEDRSGENSSGEHTVCAESETISLPPVFTLPLNTGNLYPITQSDVDEWSSLYPAVDIRQELQKMCGWCDANPTRRKTSNGIKTFIYGWLAREQDRGHKAQNTPAAHKTTEGQRLLEMIGKGEFDDNF